MTIRAMTLIVLTGASGSGKTAIAEAIETRRPGFANVFRFDQIGVPSPEVMASRVTWKS
jgi:predicted ATPase